MDAKNIIGVISHYRVTECIGQGGTGVVYWVFDLELERDVAFKVFLPEALSAPHEEAVAFIACGWAKHTGRLGVCLATTPMLWPDWNSGLRPANTKGALRGY
jgi:thiamine pyrophosphate-dependent acetolactate synthase large subunit-like protein